MASSSADPTVLFARGVLAIIELWPALRLAVAEQWGGPDSAAKRTWIASSLIDLFEESLTDISSQDGTPPIDLDDMADMLFGMVSDEFDADLEDHSPESIAADVLKLWNSVIRGSTDMVMELEQLVESNKGKQMDVVRSHEEGSESGSESGSEEDEEEDEAMDVDEQPPNLVESQANKKEEPVVDEEGFTLVQGKGKGKGKK